MYFSECVDNKTIELIYESKQKRNVYYFIPRY